MDFAGLEYPTASTCDKQSPCCQEQWIMRREDTRDGKKRLTSAPFRQLEVAKFQSTESNLKKKKEHLDTIKTNLYCW